MNESVPPWRLVAVEDIPECEILCGDIVVAFPGQPTRLLRQMPINPGLLLNLHMQDRLVPVDGMVGANAEIVAAMERADTFRPSQVLALRVVR